MASVVIHLAVAKKVGELLNKNSCDYVLGAISPDMAKIVGIDRSITHFSGEDSDIPKLDVFLDKYKKYLNTDFELGYYIHLLTDKLWGDEFLPNFIIDGNNVIDKNGNEIKLSGIDSSELLYNDYTNVNHDVIDLYKLDLDLFYTKIEYPKYHIEELPNKFDEMIEKMKFIISKSCDYNYVMDIKDIVHFIEFSSTYIVDNLKENNII